MKTKDDVKVGVFSKVIERYVTDEYLGGIIKVDKLLDTTKVGTEIHIYYEKLNKYDEIFMNGKKLVFEESESV